ncbi:MAG TPA: glycerophosphodiester phosphodiesterase [Thermoanaerobaculia bacterium]|nr:glycerophosphodiester phosphodiesterase [Thermoanaerobaculia bacterium]
MTTPIVIAHRGASGHRPEHTLAAYRLALELGADFIEPDLVATRDGVLVARHENALAVVDDAGSVIEATTDVASHPEFAERLVRKVDGRGLRGWFTEDFTLEELKTLRAIERLPALRSTEFDGCFEIPTLEEILELVIAAGEARGRPAGVYPETKYPSYFSSLGLQLEEPLVAALERFRFGGPDSPAFIQSFETSNLRRISKMTRIPLVQLIADRGSPQDLHLAGDPRTFRDLATGRELAEIASYAQAIGPSKHLIVPRTDSDSLGAQTSLVRDAHSAGLLVHAWTFRDENVFLPLEFRRKGELLGDAEKECGLFLSLGIDGLFSDYPATAIAARDRVVNSP